MAFIVEDGTGRLDANSYISVEDADEYFSERGVTAWAGTVEQKQAALIKATDYIDARFGQRFIGTTATTTQSLGWPRGVGYLVGVDVPLKLCRACAEYALRALSKPLAPDLNLDASGVVLVATKKKVGPLETEYANANAGSSGISTMMLRPYPAADMLLRGLVKSSNTVIR